MFPKSEPGPHNGLADVAGVYLGHAEVDSSGVTVVACPDGAVGAVDVRGGGPGTRETDLLKPSNSMESVHAVALCGGSAYGLDAAGGVMAGLEARGIGFPVFGDGPDAPAGPIVPIVPAAVIFDLPVGEASSRPTAETGRAALDAALDKPQDAPGALGNVGAGHAAVAGAVKGGYGEASSVIAGEPGSVPGAGRTVAVGLAVNPVGSVADPSDGTLWSAETVQHAPADLGEDGTLPVPTDQGLEAFLDRGMAGMKFPSASPESASSSPQSLNTTIGVVVTDAPVTKAQAERLAMAVHDGLSRAIRPAHLPMDGDTVFALAPSGVRTGRTQGQSTDNHPEAVDQMELAVLSAAVATCAERAVVRAVVNADSAFGIPAWAEIITGGTP